MQSTLRSLASRRCSLTRGALATVNARRAVGGQSHAARRPHVAAMAGLAARLPARGQLRMQSAEPARSLEEVRDIFKATVQRHPDKFKTFIETKEINFSDFVELFQVIVPGMGREETKALFTSMDASFDGIIQEAEIFSDVTMAVVRSRMEFTGDLHPIEGSYNCLPNPPFRRDPMQLQVVAKLKPIYDEVLAAHLKPIPTVAPSAPKKAAPVESIGVFASFFGGVRKTKPAKPAVAPVAKAEVPRPNAPKGIYLYGGCGCGKTVMLDLFFRSLPEGFTARRLHWHEFIRDAFRSMQGHPPGENVFNAMGEGLARQFRVLLLDELVITHISEAILVKNLFRQLWARGVTIITTSNYRPEELYSKGFNRDQFVEFIPELSAQCPVFDMGGERDYRKMDKVASTFFHHPMNEETSQKMDKTFEEVVEGKISKDLEVPIAAEKRNIKIPFHGLDAQGAKVARFSFDDLCVKNLGRADYSTIAEQFHTVFIDGVPKFKPDLGAEFRRYVSLIDILYGKKVALYLQSEVDTDELFANSMMSPDLDMDELWAFRRCTSMMSEMQHPKYHHMVWLMRNHLLQEDAMRL